MMYYFYEKENTWCCYDEYSNTDADHSTERFLASCSEEEYIKLEQPIRLINGVLVFGYTEEEKKSMADNEKSGGYNFQPISERTQPWLFSHMKYKPINDDLSENADFTKPLIEWNDEVMTCDRCSELMLYYLGDDDDIYNELKDKKKTSKDYIRSLFV